MYEANEDIERLAEVNSHEWTDEQWVIWKKDLYEHCEIKGRYFYVTKELMDILLDARIEQIRRLRK